MGQRRLALGHNGHICRIILGAKIAILAEMCRIGDVIHMLYLTVMTQSRPPLSHTMHPVPYSRRIFNESMCMVSKSTRRILTREAP